MERTFQADHLYLIHRGYARLTLWNKIVEAGSSYVCRVGDKSTYEALEAREHSAEAIDEGVLSDELVQLGTSQGAKSKPDHTVWLITVRATPLS